MIKSVKTQPFYMTVMLALGTTPSIKTAARKRGWNMKYVVAPGADATIVLDENTHIQVGRGCASLVRIGNNGRMAFWPARRNVAGIVADVIEMIKETK